MLLSRLSSAGPTLDSSPRLSCRPPLLLGFRVAGRICLCVGGCFGFRNIRVYAHLHTHRLSQPYTPHFTCSSFVDVVTVRSPCFSVFLGLLVMLLTPACRRRSRWCPRGWGGPRSWPRAPVELTAFSVDVVVRLLTECVFTRPHASASGRLGPAGCGLGEAARGSSPSRRACLPRGWWGFSSQ